MLAKLPAGADARDVARDAGVTLARAFPQIGWAEFAAARRRRRRRRASACSTTRASSGSTGSGGGDAFEPQIIPNDTFTATPGTFGGASTDWQWQLTALLRRLGPGPRAAPPPAIAVLDSEIDTLHPELAGKVAGAYNAERQFAATYQTPNVRASDAQIARGINNSPTTTTSTGRTSPGWRAPRPETAAGVSGAGYDSPLMASKVTLTVQDDAAGNATFVANVVDGIPWATNAGAR